MDARLRKHVSVSAVLTRGPFGNHSAHRRCLTADLVRLADRRTTIDRWDADLFISRSEYSSGGTDAPLEAPAESQMDSSDSSVVSQMAKDQLK